ncbi:MAG: Tat pathway signal sequence domain protein, partial [Opitutaceae bacterium]|nr:Tat pathway signal sequence domain protein [Opitutaceae bacterium]
MNSPLLRLCILALLGSVATAARAQDISLRWLDETPPARNTGASFGVPWPQGAVARDAAFTLSADGRALPVQTWPLAYWPDGSLKWSGVATVVPAGFAGTAKLSVARPSAASAPASGALRVTRDGRAIVIDTGALVCAIPGAGGENLIDSLRIGEREAARAGRLVCILQNGPAPEPDESAAPGREAFSSIVKSATVEQSGPVRAVVRLEGFHRGARSGREWLPFTVRLYFHSGQTAVRMVHTIVFDGDQEKDFVRGLGVRFDVPMREQARNRTVRFAGENGGVWSEPLQPGGGNVAQETGEPFAATGNFFENAIWDDFKLVQPNPRGF